MCNEKTGVNPRASVEDAMKAFRSTATCSDREVLRLFLEANATTPDDLDELLTTLHLYRPTVYAVLDSHARCSVPVPEQYRLLLPRSQLHAAMNGHDVTNNL